MKLLGVGLDDGASQNPLRQKRSQAHRRVDDGGDQRGGVGVDFRHHHHFEVLGFAPKVGAAFHQNGQIHATHLQVVGARHALFNQHVAAYKVKRKAIAEHVSKVQRQTARQGLQAQHAQQLGQARVGLHELAGLHIDIKAAPQAGVVQRQGRAQPRHLPLQLALALADQVFHAEAVEQLARVGNVQLKVHRRAALGVCGARTHLRPLAGGREHRLGHGDVETVEPPLAHAAVACRIAVDGVNFHTAQLAPAQLQIVHHNVQCGHAGGLLLQQGLHVFG